jgi:hypothetical protein
VVTFVSLWQPIMLVLGGLMHGRLVRDSKLLTMLQAKLLLMQVPVLVRFLLVRLMPLLGFSRFSPLVEAIALLLIWLVLRRIPMMLWLWFRPTRMHSLVFLRLRFLMP